MPEPEVTVAEFYAPVMSHRRPEVQKLVIRLLQSDFKQANELETSILAVAAMSRAKPIQEEWASEIDDVISTLDEASPSEGGHS